MRAGIDHVVLAVRQLIGDEDGAQYSDDDIEYALDLHRSDLWNYPLREQGTIHPGGTISYLSFYGPTYMGTTSTLYDSTYTALVGTLAPGTADWTRGYWQFAAAPVRPLSITGAAYDVTRSAIDLLQRWAASVKDQVEYSDPNFTFKLNQQAGQLLGMAHALQATLRPSVGRAVRCD